MAFVNWGDLANQHWSKSMDIVHKDRGKTRPLLLAYFEWFALKSEKQQPRLSSRLLAELDVLRK